jgi:hypothetical protein
MPMTTVARGNNLSVTNIAISITPVAVATITTATQTFNVSGLLTTDIIAAVGYVGTQIAGVFIVECDCLTNGVLTVQFGNVTAASVTPTAGTYIFSVYRADGPLPANMS